MKSIVDDSFFATPKTGKNAILLIDASGSVIFNKFNSSTFIIDQIQKVISRFPEEKFRVLFWNSDQRPFSKDNNFAKGCCKLPFVVEKSKINQSFAFIKPAIDNSCLTFPHLAFENIPTEWINDDSTKIYFITDGEMGYQKIPYSAMSELKRKLGLAITELFKTHNNIQLNIITVEGKNTDFGRIESMDSTAGGDVYNVIMSQKLTGFITRFVSFTPNNLDGYVHINKNIPQKGFIPYGDKCFSELYMSEFIQYLMALIVTIKDDSNELLKMIQLLSSSISVIIQDKPPNVIRDVIETFCGLFRDTAVDLVFVRFILSDAVKREREGVANLFVAYRSKLQSLYQQAGELLCEGVKSAIGIGEEFITFPINTMSGGHKMISGNFRLIDKSIMIAGKNYPMSSIKVDKLTIPVIPKNMIGYSAMNEQCLRQWVRQLIGKMYGVNVMEDVIMYIVLGIVFRVCISSEVDESTKNGFRKLGEIMLKKKRMNFNKTELEKLEEGELPIPNSGKIEGFYKFMDVVKSQLGIEEKINPMSLWFVLCLVLNNDKLVKNQFVHCKEFIGKDFPGVPLNKLVDELGKNITPVTSYNIPFETVLDYNCLITLDDTSKTGGFRFLPHKNMSGNVCCPVYVLSDEGYKTLVLDKTNASVCPICYSSVTEVCFEKVSAKPLEIENADSFVSDLCDMFSVGSKNVKIDMNKSTTMTTYNKSSGFSVKRENGFLIIMKGVVGSGKTTFSEKLEKKFTDMGKVVFNVGTDKFCKDGMSTGDARVRVSEELKKINDLDKDVGVVVIIDTCGESTTNKTNLIFDVDFTGWNRVNVWPNYIKGAVEGYLAWSLRNVLRRGDINNDSNFWLTPERAGVSVCINVHKKKSKDLFGKKICSTLRYLPTDKDDCIRKLNDAADTYESLLVGDMNIDNEVDKIVKKVENCFV